MSSQSNILERICDAYDDGEILKADGLDEAIIGIDEVSMRLIYSTTKCLDLLVEQGMTEEEAMEYFDFNISGAYVGERTPIWCSDNF